jgi:serine/threonine-protein kinase HipA
MPETRLVNNKYFATKRFDRTPAGKLHVISAAALLNADYRIPSLDYISQLKACRIMTNSMEDILALFRLMIFNITIKNRDDHAKNFSFIYDGERWRLAPAYDLLPSTGFGGYHTTTVNGNGTPAFGDILAVAETIGITAKKAKEISAEVAEEYVYSGLKDKIC